MKTELITADTCRCLRHKGMFVEASADTRVPDVHSRMYWCIHTMTLLGPDGRVAEPARCGPERGCHGKCVEPA